MTSLTFVDQKAADDFECQICLSTIQNAVQIGCNDHLFCQQCIMQYAQSHSHRGSFPCPICRCQSEKKSIIRVKGIDRQINKLQVKCPNHNIDSPDYSNKQSNSSHNKSESQNVVMKTKLRRRKRLAGKKRKMPEDEDDERYDDDDDDDDDSNRNTRKKRKLDVCDWIGCYSDLKQHIDSCPYQLVQCQWCRIKLMRRAHDGHIAECLLCELPCRQCNHNIARIVMNRHLKEKCPMRQVPCARCGGLVVSQRMKDHSQFDCPESLIRCRYRKYGCCMWLKRKDEENHYRSCKDMHLEQVIKKHDEASEKYEEAREKYEHERLNCKDLERRLSEAANEATEKYEEANDKYKSERLKCKDLERRLNEAIDDADETTEKYEEANDKYERERSNCKKLERRLDEAIDDADEETDLVKDLEKKIRKKEREYECLHQQYHCLQNQVQHIHTFQPVQYYRY